jgi:hypothetical protein
VWIEFSYLFLKLWKACISENRNFLAGASAMASEPDERTTAVH